MIASFREIACALLDADLFARPLKLTISERLRSMFESTNFAGAAGPSFDSARAEMVARQIRARGISSTRVLEAMAAVPRHLFVPADRIPAAYFDEPLPIGEGQTISQPYVVALMVQALELTGSERVLDIGAGSGYQAALLSLLARDVIAVESHPALAAQARARLANLGYRNVRLELGDGSLGWRDAAPFNAILVAAASPAVPAPLIEQLAEGGRLIVPVGTLDNQDLLCIRKNDGRIRQESLGGCRFVPLTGRFGWDLAAHCASDSTASSSAAVTPRA